MVSWNVVWRWVYLYLAVSAPGAADTGRSPTGPSAACSGGDSGEGPHLRAYSCSEPNSSESRRPDTAPTTPPATKHNHAATTDRGETPQAILHLHSTPIQRHGQMSLLRTYMAIPNIQNEFRDPTPWCFPSISPLCAIVFKYKKSRDLSLGNKLKTEVIFCMRGNPTVPILGAWSSISNCFWIRLPVSTSNRSYSVKDFSSQIVCT